MKAYAAVAVTVCLLGYTLGAVPRGNLKFPKSFLEAMKAPFGEVTCYNCWYSEDGESGNFRYKAGCKDPFDGSQIPNMTCNGQCTKEKKWTSSGGKTVEEIDRYCTFGCEEDDGEYTSGDTKMTSLTRCCSGKLCNRAVSVSHVSTLIMFWCLGLVTLSYQ